MQRVYATRFRRKFGVEDEMSRYVTALYDMLASVLGQVIGRPVLYVPVAFEATKQGMIQAGMPDWFAEDILRLMKTWTEGKGSRVTHDVEMVTERKPISLREFFECHKDEFIGKGGKAA